MSNWKCEICNSSFENFYARALDNKIYCPLCYYKKLYRDTELERERLNNIIKDIKSQLDYIETYSSKEDVYEDMARRLNRIENIINRK